MDAIARGQNSHDREGRLFFPEYAWKNVRTAVNSNPGVVQLAGIEFFLTSVTVGWKVFSVLWIHRMVKCSFMNEVFDSIWHNHILSDT